eukprot:CAMPEP_0177730454 /NCGR_PEP_ID=MMETSP0484_2-20121128/22000_1 /TAXON_ID=354590 /ORGANISM="Rhodomonas lens, Strain RHODO" /LENGTH=48 /DNA_ID= /DNA_START= /DNA_END= /DNA_ORIENTATION=
MVRCSSMAKALKVARGLGFLGEPAPENEEDRGGEEAGGSERQAAESNN